MPPDQFFGLIVEDRDEFVADDLALLLRFRDSGKLGKKPLSGIDGYQTEAQAVAQIGLNLLELVFAQHSVIDEDAGKSIPYGAIDEDSSDGRIDAAGKRTDSVTLAYCLQN